MHWISILTVLALTAASAWLVLFEQWQPWEAFGAMGAAAVALIASLNLVLLAMTPREDRHMLLKEIWGTMYKDLRGLIDLMWSRR